MIYDDFVLHTARTMPTGNFCLHFRHKGEWGYVTVHRMRYGRVLSGMV